MGVIFMLHRIGPPQYASGLNAFLSCAPDFLDELFGALKREGWRFVTLDEVADPLCTIGAHTSHHFSLRRLERSRAMEEIAGSVRRIGAEIGQTPRHFAYPYGGPSAVGEREVDLVREAGLATAVTTRHGLLQPGHADHLHALPRISLNGEYQQPHYVETMLSGLTVALANRGRRLVTL